MSKGKEVIWRAFGNEDEGTTTWLIIDNRERLEGDVQINTSGNHIALSKKKWWSNMKWTPIAAICVSGRFTPAEHEARAQVICDALNAHWVKDQLQGDK